MLKGFNSTIDIQIYWNICEKTYIESEHQQTYPDLIKRLVELYSYIIEYQARVICHLSLRQLKRAWQKVAGWNEWLAKAGKIDDMSKRCRDCILAVEEGKIRDRWNHQLQEIQESRAILDEIRHILYNGGRQTEQNYEDQEERKLLQYLAASHEDNKNVNPEKVPGTWRMVLRG